MPVALREITGRECLFLDSQRNPNAEKPDESQSPSLNPLHREFFHHLHLLAVLGGDPSPLPGDGSWSEDAPVQHLRMEGHWPLVWLCGV